MKYKKKMSNEERRKFLGNPSPKKSKEKSLRQHRKENLISWYEYLSK